MHKPKRQSPSNIGKKLFKVLLILIAIPVLTKLSCYGFARFGGEWATANVLPVHPESVYMGAIYEDGFAYRIKYSIYNSALSADDLRTWYIDRFISLTPIPYTDYLGNSKTLESDGYYGTTWAFDRSDPLQELHKVSAWFSGWFDEMARSCQSIRVYYDLEIFKQDYPEIQSDSLITPYVVGTCWPNVK